ncbi:MAG TPA: glucose-1-phosphate adenylyltransferase subunit GlgD [Clostridiales bacterium]|nr:glucose-1-phosphate adenylyltransferase subunit GlgD [Clostridiales bacterium]
MKGNNVLGVIFANSHDDRASELTDKRTMSSVPFGGKYRLIDFTLSNMVNSGINSVGVIVRKNFFSLMDHVASGKAWDLSRKRGGLKILPPFIQGDNSNNTPIECLYSVRAFLEDCKEDYMLLCECDCVANIDYSQMLEQHIKNEADVTMMYVSATIPEARKEPMVLKLGTDNRIEELLISPQVEGSCNLACSSVLISRQLLLDLVKDSVSKNMLNYKRCIFQNNIKNYKFYGYEYTGYNALITSMNSYFSANMALMNPAVRKELFNADRPIYTKVRDDMPSRYGLGSSVKNSLIAQGCLIEGHVENCVISKGVHIGKGTTVSNCVIMQDTKIGKNANLSYVICDKDVVIKDDRSLCGFESYPIYIQKQSVV